MAIERIDVVSTSPARHDSFARLLPHADVRQLNPRFTEELMQRPLNVQPAEWPMEMAERKALQDVVAVMVQAASGKLASENVIKEIGSTTEGRHLRLYSDTITISYAAETSDETPRVLEKPRDLVSWFTDKDNGALALSGKNVEICTGITAIDMKNLDSHPATVLVRIVAKMRPYGIEEIQKIIEKNGPQAVLTTAGGISIWNGGTALYEADTPLKIFLQTDPFQQPVLINEINGWQKLDSETLKQILYGAVPEAMDGLTRKLDSLAAQRKIIKSIPVAVKQAKSNLADSSK